jgi:hypothetical protein
MSTNNTIRGILDDIARKILISHIYLISNDESNDNEYIDNKKIELIHLLIDMQFKDRENIDRIKKNIIMFIIFNENFSDIQLNNIKESIINDLSIIYKDLSIDDLLFNLRNTLLSEIVDNDNGFDVNITLPSEGNPLEDDMKTEKYSIFIMDNSRKIYMKILKDDDTEYNVELF